MCIFQSEELLACLLVVVGRISTMTLYCWSVSFAVYDGYKDDCGDRSLKHRFCHIGDMQARLELLEKLHVYELGDRWLPAHNSRDIKFVSRDYFFLARSV